ncbi:MAG: HNH endonuclease [Mucilaginibacter sp.]
MGAGILLIMALMVTLILALRHWVFEIGRKRRRDYYRESYLKSDAWKRKRYVVLKRDNWRCVYCGALATQVHHTRYAKYNIGKEPIEWLVSICQNCHESIHHKQIKA